MPIVRLLKKIGAVMDVPSCDKIIKYTVFEDDNGATELTKVLKMRPRTKHIAIKYHHFGRCVQKREIIIEKVDTAGLEAEFLIKPLVLQLFSYLRKKVTG